MSLCFSSLGTESNPSQSENKREQVVSQGGNTPQNKNRKGEKLDSAEDIDFTVICPAEQPQTMLPGGVKMNPHPWDRKREEERLYLKRSNIYVFD